MTRTISEVLEETVEAYGQRPAMRCKRDNGEWYDISWAEYRRDARNVAKAFIKLGVDAGAGVSIIGYNCSQWFMADIGAILAGCVPAGIYTTCSPEQCQYITHHCEAAIAFVENAEQLEKFKAVRSELPHLKALVMMEGDDADEEGSWRRL